MGLVWRLPSLGSLMGLPLNMEILLFAIVGIVYTSLDTSIFNLHSNLKQIWSIPIPEASLTNEMQNPMRILLTTIVIVRSCTSHLHLACYIIMLYPILCSERPSLLLPWLVVGAIKQICMTVLSLSTGLLVCASMNILKEACGYFVAARFIELTPALYMWSLVYSLYREIKFEIDSKAQLNMNPAEALEQLVRRRRARLMEEGPEKKVPTRPVTTRTYISESRSLDALMSHIPSGVDVTVYPEMASLTPAQKTQHMLGLTDAEVSRARRAVPHANSAETLLVVGPNASTAHDTDVNSTRPEKDEKVIAVVNANENNRKNKTRFMSYDNSTTSNSSSASSKSSLEVSFSNLLGVGPLTAAAVIKQVHHGNIATTQTPFLPRIIASSKSVGNSCHDCFGQTQTDSSEHLIRVRSSRKRTCGSFFLKLIRRNTRLSLTPRGIEDRTFCAESILTIASDGAMGFLDSSACSSGVSFASARSNFSFDNFRIAAIKTKSPHSSREPFESLLDVPLDWDGCASPILPTSGAMFMYISSAVAMKATCCLNVARMAWDNLRGINANLVYSANVSTANIFQQRNYITRKEMQNADLRQSKNNSEDSIDSKETPNTSKEIKDKESVSSKTSNVSHQCAVAKFLQEQQKHKKNMRANDGSDTEENSDTEEDSHNLEHTIDKVLIELRNDLDRDDQNRIKELCKCGQPLQRKKEEGAFKNACIRKALNKMREDCKKCQKILDEDVSLPEKIPRTIPSETEQTDVSIYTDKKVEEEPKKPVKIQIIKATPMDELSEPVMPKKTDTEIDPEQELTKDKIKPEPKSERAIPKKTDMKSDTEQELIKDKIKPEQKLPTRDIEPESSSEVKPKTEVKEKTVRTVLLKEAPVIESETKDEALYENDTRFKPIRRSPAFVHDSDQASTAGKITNENSEVILTIDPSFSEVVGSKENQKADTKFKSVSIKEDKEKVYERYARHRLSSMNDEEFEEEIKLFMDRFDKADEETDSEESQRSYEQPKKKFVVKEVVTPEDDSLTSSATGIKETLMDRSSSESPEAENKTSHEELQAKRRLVLKQENDGVASRKIHSKKNYTELFKALTPKAVSKDTSTNTNNVPTRTRSSQANIMNAAASKQPKKDPETSDLNIRRYPRIKEGILKDTSTTNTLSDHSTESRRPNITKIDSDTSDLYVKKYPKSKEGILKDTSATNTLSEHSAESRRSNISIKSSSLRRKDSNTSTRSYVPDKRTKSQETLQSMTKRKDSIRPFTGYALVFNKIPDMKSDFQSMSSNVEVDPESALWASISAKSKSLKNCKEQCKRISKKMKKRSKFEETKENLRKFSININNMTQNQSENFQSKSFVTTQSKRQKRFALCKSTPIENLAISDCDSLKIKHAKGSINIKSNYLNIGKPDDNESKHDTVIVVFGSNANNAIDEKDILEKAPDACISQESLFVSSISFSSSFPKKYSQISKPSTASVIEAVKEVDSIESVKIDIEVIKAPVIHVEKTEAGIQVCTLSSQFLRSSSTFNTKNSDFKNEVWRAHRRLYMRNNIQ